MPQIEAFKAETIFSLTPKMQNKSFLCQNWFEIYVMSFRSLAIGLFLSAP